MNLFAEKLSLQKFCASASTSSSQSSHHSFCEFGGWRLEAGAGLPANALSRSPRMPTSIDGVRCASASLALPVNAISAAGRIARIQIVWKRARVKSRRDDAAGTRDLSIAVKSPRCREKSSLLFLFSCAKPETRDEVDKSRYHLSTNGEEGSARFVARTDRSFASLLYSVRRSRAPIAQGLPRPSPSRHVEQSCVRSK